METEIEHLNKTDPPIRVRWLVWWPKNVCEMNHVPCFRPTTKLNAILSQQTAKYERNTKPATVPLETRPPRNWTTSKRVKKTLQNNRNAQLLYNVHLCTYCRKYIWFKSVCVALLFIYIQFENGFPSIHVLLLLLSYIFGLLDFIKTNLIGFSTRDIQCLDSEWPECFP